ncbi:MAG: glutamyl endopeptidase [Acidobacteriota bacterium]|jgi:V8-like Glu-specific endopeptidase|nr:glutamyl endopeptidase [Acidobacteriota bacterium]
MITKKETEPQKTNKADAAAASGDKQTGLRFPRVPQEELRDIGELTFGKRDRTAPTHQPGGTSAANSAERVRISGAEITDSPWRKICDLLITARDGSLHTGTAWLISARTLVTAGHCISVFNPGSPAHGKVRKILVMPARNGEMDETDSPFGWVEVERADLRVHPNWEHHGNLDFDYGAILLPEEAPLGEQIGFLDFGNFLDSVLDESTPTLSGYPDNVLEGTQWREENLIKQVTPTRVFYDIFTFSGQSGSPVFFPDGGQIACAIHSFGDNPLNSGVRINQQVIDQLNEWIEETL